MAANDPTWQWSDAGVDGQVPSAPGTQALHRSDSRYATTGVPSVDSGFLGYQQESQFHDQQTVQNATEKTPRWPTTPTELRTSGWGTLYADITAVLFSMPFLVLAIVLMRLDGVRVDERRQQYTNAILVAATLFPIVFASVTGRLTSQVARWKLERGSRIESLEQWLGSRTVFTAIYTQIRLSSFNMAAVFLSVVWAFSPLSTQSVQRQLGTNFGVDETGTSAIYFNTDAPSGFASHVAVSPGSFIEATAWKAVVNSLYSVALLAPDETWRAPTDLWGNLKIPLLSSHHPSGSGPEWSHVPANGPTIYSSLSGLPIPTLPPGNSTFNIESSYIQLSCSIPVSHAGYEQTEIEPFPNNQNNRSLVPGNQTLYGYRFNATEECPQGCPDRRGANWWLALKGLYVNPNWTDPAWHWSRDGVNWTFESSYTTPAVFRNETGIEPPQATVVLGTIERRFGSHASQDFEGLVSCAVSQPYAESRVECLTPISSSSINKPNCKVVSQRPSQKPHASSNITHLSFFEVFRGLSQTMPRATGFQDIGSIQDPSIYYLANESTHIFQAEHSVSSNSSSMLSNVSAPLISQRLTQLINTYLLLSQAVADVKNRDIFDVGDVHVVNGPATSQRLVELYTVTWVWAGLFLAGSLVLLACSLASIVFAHMAVTPDIMGCASSSIRDSRYVQLPYGAGALDGLALARALKGESIQYGVVGEAVGMAEGEPPTLGVSWTGYVDRARRGGRYW